MQRNRLRDTASRLYLEAKGALRRGEIAQSELDELRREEGDDRRGGMNPDPLNSSPLLRRRRPS